MYILSFLSKFELLRKLLYWGTEEIAVETIFFYSPCMKYLKTDIIVKKYSEYRLLWVLSSILTFILLELE